MTNKKDKRDATAFMRWAFSVGSMPLHDLKADNGPSLRGLMPDLLDKDGKFRQPLSCQPIRVQGKLVGVTFPTTNDDGETLTDYVRYDAEGRRAMARSTVLYAGPCRSTGQTVGNSKEDRLYRSILADMHANEDLLADMLGDVNSAQYHNWRLRASRAFASRASNAIVNDGLHNGIHDDPRLLGGLATTLRFRPYLRGVVADITIGHDKRPAQQMLAREPYGALQPRQVEKRAGLKRNARLRASGFADGAAALNADAVSAIAVIAATRGVDISPKALDGVLPKAVLAEMRVKGRKQRQIVVAIAQLWTATHDADATERLGLWLVRAMQTPEAPALSLTDIKTLTDYAGLPAERIEQLRRLFTGTPARAQLIRPFDVDQTLEEALACAQACVDALQEERELISRRALRARVEDEKRKYELRLKEMAAPFKPAGAYPTETIRMPKSRWRMEWLTNEDALIAEGAEQRNCLATKAANARANRQQYYYLWRPATKAEREDKKLGRKKQVREHAEHGFIVRGGSVSLSQIGDEVRIAEIRAPMNGPVDQTILRAVRRFISSINHQLKRKGAR